ncbi:MAG TPA: pilus assembly protein TadG-related protein [Actinomycetota bacterium]|nr:pilus assembly protein TadG-related protein [Actinomycetota bacterium]
MKLERNECGQVLVLVIGVVLVLFAVSGLAIDGTRVFIERRALQNLGDAAARAAAGTVDVGRYYRSGGTEVALDPAGAREAAMSMLSQRGMTGDAAVSGSPDFVTVRLRSSVPTTFLRLVGIDAIPVGIVASARPFQRLPGGP